MQDEQQERARSQRLKQQQELSHIAVTPPTFLCSTLQDAHTTATLNLCAVRWNPTSPALPSHVVANRGSSLDVYAIRWTNTAAAAGVSPNAAAVGELMQAEGQAEQQPADASWSLQLLHVAQPEVLGSIQQISVLPSQPQDLLLLTSDSGFLSVLTFEPQGVDIGRLRALAHTRIGAAGLGMRQIGSFLRVSIDAPHAIAVASRQACGAADKGAVAGNGERWWTQGEGGILVFPMMPSAAAAAPVAATPSAAAAAAAPLIGEDVQMLDESQSIASPNSQSQRTAASSSVASSSPSPLLPQLRTPIEVTFDGVLSALLFLPPSPSQPHLARLLMAYAPTSRKGHSSMQLAMVQLDFATNSFVLKPYDLQLPRNSIVVDLLLVSPRNKTPAAATSAAAASSSSSAAAAASAARSPCFVLLQLETSVMLLDVNSASTLQFPASAPLPGWADPADQALQLTVGPVPLVTSWTWIRDQHLACVTETGDVHLLHLWFNEAGGQMPGVDAAPQQWLRFVPLGLATPSACMLALSAPSSAQGASTDFLFLPGEAAEGMMLRVDWACVERNLRASSQQESALEREHHLSNSAPLFDFVSVNATLNSAFPSKHVQLYQCSGIGRHGAMRVLRPNTIEAEIVDADEQASSENKIFLQLLPLRTRNSATQRVGTVALVYSFVGSTRVRALINGTLEDVSDAVAAGGFELTRTTLDAALVCQQRVLLQVDDRSVRAVSMQASAERFTGERLSATWTPATDHAHMSSSSAAGTALFTHAHISDDWILLSLPATRAVVLLQFCTDPAGASAFVVRGQAKVDSDVSTLHIGRIGVAASPDSLLCMVATHDCKVHFFKIAATADNSAAADLLLYRTLELTSLLPVARESDLSSVAESLLLCSAPTSASAPYSHLFIGLRDGHVLRCSLYPNAPLPSAAPLPASEEGWIRECIVRRLGSARVKLVRLEGAGVDASGDTCLLAMCDQTYVLRSPMPAAAADSGRRHFPVRVRELVWSWNTPLSSVVQFAAPFAHAAMPNGVACVVGGQFHIADLDPSRSAPSISKAFLLGGTPRRIIHHPPSNLMCILTMDHDRSGAHSRLLLVDPLSGEIRCEHDFRTRDLGDEVHSLLLFNRPKDTPLILVGAAAKKTPSDVDTVAKVYAFELKTDVPGADPAAAAAAAAASVAPAAMDLSEDSPPLPAVSSLSPSASPSRLYCAFEFFGPTNSGRATCMVQWRPAAFFVGMNNHVLLVQLSVSKTGSGALLANPVLRFDSPYPVWDISTPNQHQLCVVDQRQGVSILTVDTHSETPRLRLRRTHTDPYARVARQAISFAAQARMQPVHTLPANQTGHPIVLGAASVAAGTAATSAPALPAAATTTATHTAQVMRTIGIDVYGRVFVLRQDPSDESALVFKAAPTTGGAATTATSTSTTAAPSPRAPSATMAAASSSSASAAAAPRAAVTPFIVSTSLVQEASFQLGSTPSRVRLVSPPAGVAAASGCVSSLNPHLFMLSGLLGSIHAVRELDSSQVSWLRGLQHQLATSPLTRSLVANHHASFRSFHGHDNGVAPASTADTEQMIDGDLLATFDTLSLQQQQQICARLPKQGGVERKPWQVQEELQQLLAVHI